MGENQKWSVCAWPDLVVVWVGGLGVLEVVFLLLYFLSVGLFPGAVFFRGAFGLISSILGLCLGVFLGLCMSLSLSCVWELHLMPIYVAVLILFTCGGVPFSQLITLSQPYNIAEFL